MEAKNRPTKKQRELLNFIESFIAQYGYAPSYREIMRSVGCKSVSTVAAHIDNLIAKGHLRKRDSSARSLEVCRLKNSMRSTMTNPATAAQEKWLIEAISAKFDSVEASPPAHGHTDPLYVLVGALQILGLYDAATASKARLLALEQKLGSSATSTTE
jgi:SOS-response transcriptional repressor LexA